MELPFLDHVSLVAERATIALLGREILSICVLADMVASNGY